MVLSAAEEKKLDEKRIKELREFQRSNNANRRCFDCNEMMPQYICLDFNTFVCTSCSGIHREFAHRVKSISMSKFTDTEVKNMLKFGGNEQAQKYWRANFDHNFRLPGNNEGERTRNLIRLTYIDRKWVLESPKEPKRTDSGSSKKQQLNFSHDEDFFASSKSKTSSNSSFDAFGSNNNKTGSKSKDTGGFAQFGDFSAFDSTPSATTKSSNQPKNDFGDFGSFDTPSSSNKKVSATPFDDFDSFGTPTANAAEPAPRANSGKLNFTIAPPPGSSFSSASYEASNSRNSSNSSKQTPAASTNDFLAFSPEKTTPVSSAKNDDPFGITSPTSVSSHTGIPSSSTSAFDAFGTGTPTGGARPTSTSFDAFGAGPLSVASTTSAPSGGFDAFGGSSHPARPTSVSFDAFGASTTPSGNTHRSSFDAFDGVGTSAPTTATRATSASFDAFGGGSAATTPSAGLAIPASDPFSAFSPRTSSNPTKTASFEAVTAAPSNAPAASAAAKDPFAAFEDIDSSSSSDPFGAASMTSASSSNATTTTASSTSMFGGASSSTPTASHPSGSVPAPHPFGGMPTQGTGSFHGGMPQASNMGGMHGNMQYHGGKPGMGMGVNINNPGMFGGFGAMPSQAGQQQQQPGTAGMFSPQQKPQSFGQQPAATPAAMPGGSSQQPQQPSVSALNDPFASLNIGFMGDRPKSKSTAAAPVTSSSPFGIPTSSSSAMPTRQTSSFGKTSSGSSLPMQHQPVPAAFAAPTAPFPSSSSDDAFGDFSFAAPSKPNSSANAAATPAASVPAAASNPFDMF